MANGVCSCLSVCLQPTLVQSIFLNDPGQLESELSSCPLPDGPNSCDEQRRTLLHAAAFCGNVHITKMLLAKGARVNAKDVFWITPLHRVCCREEVPGGREEEALKPDLMLGLDVDRPSPRGRRSLLPGNFTSSYKEPQPFVTINHFPNGTTSTSVNPINSNTNNNHDQALLNWILGDISDHGGPTSPVDPHNLLVNGTLPQASVALPPNGRVDFANEPSTLKNSEWFNGCGPGVSRNENSVGLVRCNSQSFQTHLPTLEPLNLATLDDDEDWPDYGETCRTLLEAGADVSARDKLWQTPLHVAAANNAFTCAQAILAHQERRQAATNGSAHLKFNFLDISDKFGRTCLHHAVFNGHVQMARLLLDHGASPDILDKKQRRPAHYAAFLGHADLLRLLAQHGAQLEVFDQDRLTPLHAACAGGRSVAVQALLAMGARVDVPDARGNTGLHICSLNGKCEVASCLIAAHAPVSAKNALGYTPLHYAAASTHGGTCVQLLLVLGAMVNAKSGSGRTPLHMSAIHGRVTRAQNLINAGALLNTADRHGLTTLHIAARYGHELLVQCLLDRGAQAGHTARDGSSALHLAALYGHSGVCHKLVAAGADILGRDNAGRTAIHCAAFAGNLELVSEFYNFLGEQKVTKGLSFEVIVDSNGRTPLHYAVSNRQQHRDVNLLAYLSQRFPLDAGRPDVDGRTPLHLACALQDDLYVNFFLGLLKADEWCKLLDISGAGPLHYAAHAGNDMALKTILSQLSGHDIRSIVGRPPMAPTQRLSPIELAARGGHLECLRLLLEFAARWDANDGDEQKSTLQRSASSGQRPDLALIIAARHNREDCLLYLLKSGLYDVNVCDRRGRTPLMHAAMRSSGPTIRALLKQGGDVSLRDNRGLGVLHYAFNNPEATRELLEAGASILTRVKAPCKSPLHLAALTGNAKVLHALAEALQAELAADSMTASVTAANGLSFGGRRSLLSLRDPQGYSVLHYACYSGNRECVGLLLRLAEDEMSEDAELHVAPRAHFSELHCAAGHLNGVSLLESLIKLLGGQAVHARDARGRTALHVAAIRGVPRNCDVLISRGGRVDERDNQGYTPLTLAAQNGQCSVIELLLSRGADPLAQDCEGATALHRACLAHQEAVVQLLLERPQTIAALMGTGSAGLSVLVNVADHEGRTALHLAARNGLVSATQLLIQKGADVMAKDRFGHTPALCCATNAQVARCLKLILDVSPMAFAGGTSTGPSACPDMPSPPLSEEEEENFTH
ncbi:serine/threonine-protein phosphatase 6 regulatory ankyrin repeat subunit C-like [Tropilaelaps mercedesae]|uniref:Serine/threonine-protein phosphatase 6 regulatory ankyrin repeat subunit C-like n=1 Tax=Tropilaelaps mercedesae TaxID=418985 RepID=A0A1V9XBZ9_9ACAR|nr:serine/threonine-protein phosphatase 6 regulatory ankyrin repeat subunit C-like [Tropilaelaps mercedesae]